MTLTKAQVLARIDNIITDLSHLKDEISLGSQAAPAADANLCPVHKIAWINTKYGQAHKLADGSGKWCNKEKLK